METCASEKLNSAVALVKRGNLSEMESRQVFTCYQETRDRELLNVIFEANEGLVHYCMKKFLYLEDYEDILQEGRIGLVKAIMNYDPDLGYAFSTFACSYIKGHIQRYLNTYMPIRIPTHIVEKMNAVYRLQSRNCEITDEEIAKKVGISLDELQEYGRYKAINAITSLDVQVGEDEDTPLADLLPMENSDVSKNSEIQVIHDVVMKAVSKVMSDDKKINIAKSAFGLDCEKRMMRDIAAENGISYQYVSQIANKLVWQLRKPYMKSYLRESLGVPKSVPDEEVTSYLYKE